MVSSVLKTRQIITGDRITNERRYAMNDFRRAVLFLLDNLALLFMRRGTMAFAIAKMLRGVRTVAIICTQWGDSGKGKFVDLLAEWADIIVRGTGGGNAGHTIWIKMVKYVLT